MSDTIENKAQGKKIALLTSGGDAPGMNAAIRSIVRMGIDAGMEVIGIERGYVGLIEKDFRPMKWTDVGDTIHRGGTILKTARCSRFMEDYWIDLAARNLSESGIEGLVVIGGDGTFRGGKALHDRGVQIIGIPATIDNDLGYTECTIGFDTAVNTILDLISKIRDTSSSHQRTTIIEVMGRECGDVALYAGMAGGADYYLLPEIDNNIEKLIETIRVGRHNGKMHSIIMKAEGADIPLQDLEKLLEERTGQSTRSVVPGYIQRGGTPTAQDRIFATRAGAEAIRILAEGNDSCAIGISGGELLSIDLTRAVEIPHEFREDVFNTARILG